MELLLVTRAGRRRRMQRRRARAAVVPLQLRRGVASARLLGAVCCCLLLPVPLVALLLRKHPSWRARAAVVVAAAGHCLWQVGDSAGALPSRPLLLLLLCVLLPGRLEPERRARGAPRCCTVVVLRPKFVSAREGAACKAVDQTFSF
jgi:hypothetical protein